MAAIDGYYEYAQAALANHKNRDAASRYTLYEAVKHLPVKRVLDVGCGAGQELLPFLEKASAFCVGIDIAKELGPVTKAVFANEERVAAVRSEGEMLPFASGSFDVVLCRVALPYMNNRKAIAEAARVLKPGGVYLLKTHAPPFYSGMIRERLSSLNPKQLAYPLICLAASFWHSVTGTQLQNGFWQGKEIFQTQTFLETEFRKNGMKIKGFLADDNPKSPSYVVEKI